LEIEISCSQWEGSAYTQSALIFLKIYFGWWGCGGFFSFFLCSQHVPFKFSMGSHQVLKMSLRFSMCSQRVFPIAPRFNPICFAQSPPLLTYIGGLKGEALHLSRESSIYGSLILSTLFFICQSNWFIAKKKKKKVELVSHPQLINMKQNK
jgi:hypothetical protein